MIAECLPAERPPHPLAVAKAALAAERFPVVLWHASGDRTLVSAGRALSGACASDTWRVDFPAVCSRLLAESTGMGAGSHVQALFSMYFDPGQDEDAEWRGFPATEIFIPEFQYAFQKPQPLFNFIGDKTSIENGKMLANKSISNPRHTVKTSGSLTIDWNDESYSSAVRSALEFIAKGGVDKIVIARKIGVGSSGEIDPIVLMDKLVRLYPECFLYFHAVSPDSYFISATPERLARTERGRFSTNAVAGTLPRDPAGVNDDEQEHMLLESEKNRAEHAFVLDMLKETASGFCRDLLTEETRVAKLRNVFHLVTPLSGILLTGKGLADAVAALHPTPAVCGTPRASAMTGIRRIEQFRRGQYAGCAGWMDAAGNGEAAVTIRSALIRQNTASVFAGAGIVRASDLDEELRETRVKAQAMVEALN